MADSSERRVHGETRSLRRAGTCFGLAFAAHAALGWWVLAPAASSHVFVPVVESEARLIDVPVEVEESSAGAEAASRASSAPRVRATAAPRKASVLASAAGETPQPDVTAAHTDGERLALEGADTGGAVAGSGVGPGEGTGSLASGSAAKSERVRARLLSDSRVCRGLFPHSAKDPESVVSVAVNVSKVGSATFRELVAPSPHDRSFDAAAQACASRLRFLPARDGTGDAVTTQSVVKLRFAKWG